MFTKRLKMDDLEKFHRSYEVSPDGCWIWRKGVGSHGYPEFYHGEDGNKKLILGHRYAYLTLNGQITPGLEIDQRCRNGRCVNPEHLELITGSINNQRMVPFRKKASPPVCADHRPKLYRMRRVESKREVWYIVEDWLCEQCRRITVKRVAHQAQTRKNFSLTELDVL